jgi:6-pyruvoyltetrahydropterin/6-carboxytetrahydropterin synthase
MLYSMALAAVPRSHTDIATSQSQPIVRLSRTFNVSAAHRLHSVHLSDEENAKLYGPCNRPHGHGHNYKITVSLAGQVSMSNIHIQNAGEFTLNMDCQIDPRTGMVVNLRVLKSIAQQYVAELLDHRNLVCKPYVKPLICWLT